MSELSGLAFSPLTIGPLKLRNRFIKAATNEGMAKNSVVSKGLAQFHEGIARGGAALTTVAYCATSSDGRTFLDQAILHRKSMADLKALTAGVHRHGAAASAQITHAGSFTFLDKNHLQTSRPMSSSGGFNKVGVMSGRWLKRAMTADDIAAMTGEFVAAAKLARDCGFDAVELHMGHGYILSQFISPLYNKRHDAYGGTIAKRLRFPIETLQRVLDAVGKDTAVIAKYSMTDGVPAGNRIEDGVEVAKALEKAGAHMAVLSNGMNIESITAMFGSSFPAENRSANPNPIIRIGMWLQTMNQPKHVEFRENYLRDHALKVRAAVQMPLGYLGGIKTMNGVGTAMADGFDAVVMGRALLNDANIINDWTAGSLAPSQCCSCNRCVSTMYLPSGTHCAHRQAPDAALNKIAAGATPS